MIAPELIKVKVSKNVGFMGCAICKSGEGTENKIKRLGRSFVVVCRDCIEEFVDEDLELMYNMFAAYGGYFGKLGGSKEESYRKLKEIAVSYKENGRSASSVGFDVVTMHQAFLHGIPFAQLVRGLEILLEQR